MNVDEAAWRGCKLILKRLLKGNSWWVSGTLSFREFCINNGLFLVNYGREMGFLWRFKVAKWFI